MHIPPVIRKGIEDAEEDDEESRGLFCVEANSYHRA
jgi:hypothetical protein